MNVDNPDVREMAMMEAMVKSLTVKLSEVKKKRDDLRAELERLRENDGCSVTEEQDEGGLLQDEGVE